MCVKKNKRSEKQIRKAFPVCKRSKGVICKSQLQSYGVGGGGRNDEKQEEEVGSDPPPENVLVWLEKQPAKKIMKGKKKIEEQESLGVRGSGAVACR